MRFKRLTTESGLDSNRPGRQRMSILRRSLSSFLTRRKSSSAIYLGSVSGSSVVICGSGKMIWIGIPSPGCRMEAPQSNFWPKLVFENGEYWLPSRDGLTYPLKIESMEATGYGTQNG